jgi:hypothetical protein
MAPRPLKGFLAGVALVALGTAAAAATGLDIETVHGNPTGCEFVRTGQAPSDDVFVLRPGELQQYESRCEFVDVRRSSFGASAVRSICQGEGMVWLNDFVVSPSREDENALVVSFQQDRPNVTVTPCKTP